MNKTQLHTYAQSNLKTSHQAIGSEEVTSHPDRMEQITRGSRSQDIHLQAYWNLSAIWKKCQVERGCISIFFILY